MENNMIFLEFEENRAFNTCRPMYYVLFTIVHVCFSLCNFYSVIIFWPTLFRLHSVYKKFRLHYRPIIWNTLSYICSRMGPILTLWQSCDTWLSLKAPNMLLKETRDQQLSNGAGHILLQCLQRSSIAFKILIFFQNVD